MRKIHLHGKLSEAFDTDVIELHVSTAGEAVRAMALQNRKFMELMCEGEYRVVRGKPEDGFDLDLDTLNTFNLGNCDLHIVPVVEGSSKRGAIKTILGTAIVGAAVVASGGALAAPLGAGLLSGITYGNIAFVGLGLALSGVSSLLSSSNPTEEKDDSSFTLAGPTNVYEQGNPGPIVYGEVITGAALVSAGVDIENIGAY